jgi:hypothetical protein
VPGGEDGRQRDIEQLRRALRARRARLEPGPPPPHAPVGTGPVGRPVGPRLELDRPAPPAAAAPAAAAGGPPLLPPAPPVPARRTRWARRLVVPAVALAVGLAFGLALGSWSGRVGGPAAAPAAPPPASAPATAPATSVVVRPTASSACLETAKRADEVIHLLITNERSRAARVLVAYTIASRQCRRDASP